MCDVNTEPTALIVQGLMALFFPEYWIYSILALMGGLVFFVWAAHVAVLGLCLAARRIARFIVPGLGR